MLLNVPNSANRKLEPNLLFIEVSCVETFGLNNHSLSPIPGANKLVFSSKKGTFWMKITVYVFRNGMESKYIFRKSFQIS